MKDIIRNAWSKLLLFLILKYATMKNANKKDKKLKWEKDTSIVGTVYMTNKQDNIIIQDNLVIVYLMFESMINS
jgi:hypothetical protein